MSVSRRLQRELREALHHQLDTVLNAAHEPTGHRVIDNLLTEAEQGRIIDVSIHTRPGPVYEPDDVPAGP